MKYAFCSEVFKGPIESTIRHLAEIGYDGIEIAPFNVAEDVEEVSAKRRTEIRNVARECGLDIVGLHWLLVSPAGLHITTPDEGLRRRSWSYLHALGRFCSDLGGKVMILGSPAQRNLVEGDTLEAATERVVEPLRKLGEELSGLGVRLLLEPLDPEQTDFLSRAVDAVDLAQRVDHPQIGYMMDTRALSHMEGGVLENIREFGQGAGHYHVNEPDGKGPGMGDFDFAPVLAALKKARFLGWVSAEPFQYEPDSLTVARTALETLREAEVRASS